MFRYGHVPKPSLAQSALTEPNDNLFVSGIRALYGQLSSCKSPLGGPIRSLGVTSCCRQEGKSTVAAQLANIAAEGLRVLLIDANGAWSNVRRAMQEAAYPGMAQLDDTRSDETHQRHNVPPHVLQEALGNGSCEADQRRELLQTLTSKYDLLIADLPAVNAPGSMEWAPTLDGMLLIVEAERVRWQVAARGVRLLEQAGGRVLGSVINKRRNHIPDWLYWRL